MRLDQIERKRIFGLGTATVLLLFATSLWFPVWTQFRPTRNQPLARSKQLAVAASQYCIDNDGRFPPDMSSGHAAYRYVHVYLNDVSLLDAQNGIFRERLGNGNLAKHRVSVIDEPNRTMMFFDSGPRSIPEKVRQVSTVDTSTRSVGEPSFQEALSNRWILKSLY